MTTVPSATTAEMRLLRLPGTRNLRDVGGYDTGAGRRTRWRTLLRSDALDRLPPSSQALLIELGLRQVIDLRWPDEVEKSPSVFRGSDLVRYRNIPLLDEPLPPETGIQATYRTILDRRGAAFANVVRALLEPDGLPALVGCAAGVDRTGLTTAVILSAIGVDGEAVAADYALSADCFAGDGVDSGLDDWRAGSVQVDCPPAYMTGALDHLDRQHGGAVTFLRQHGVTDDDLARLADRLTEPSTT